MKTKNAAVPPRREMMLPIVGTRSAIISDTKNITMVKTMWRFRWVQQDSGAQLQNLSIKSVDTNLEIKLTANL